MTPLTTEEREMYHEIREDLRATRQELIAAVERVHSSLDDHVRSEDLQYSELRADNAKLRVEVSDLRIDMAQQKTRWGMLASVAGAVGATIMAGIITVLQKVFF